MNDADAAQCKILRLAYLQDKLDVQSQQIRGLAATVERDYQEPDVANEISQAETRLRAALQLVRLKMRNL